MSISARLLAVLTLVLCLSGCQQREQVDLIISGGRVINSPATALAMRGARIVAVGSDAEISRLTAHKTIDVAGATICPGFNDSHAHLYGVGIALGQLDLIGTSSAAAVVTMAAAAHASLPDGIWLEGRGWDQNDWEIQKYPTAAQLDAVTGDRPTLLRRVDGHAAWANSAALRAAGINDQTPDPYGGEIARDKHGHPTGILFDNAVDLIRQFIPEVSDEELVRLVKLAVRHCWAQGVTSVHEPGVSWRRARLYRRLAASGNLQLRLYGMYDDIPATLDSAFAEGPFFSADSLLTLRAIKLYADGALGSRGALLLADYSDKPGHRGLSLTSTTHLAGVILRGAEAGFQICTHAIGDGAVRQILGLYEELVLPHARWRIEHAQIVAPADIPHFAELGVIAAMQPTHCTSDMDWADERLGQSRLAEAYVWRSFLDQGVPVCFGTDAPVERINPLAGLYAARTRTHPDGTPIGGWQPQEILTAAEAFSLYTEGSAYAAFRESDLGQIAPGYLADVVVLDGNPITCTPDELLSMQVLHTVVNGELVYSR